MQFHDFPGQGTALVGVLNPFFESKGYITPEEFRMFCSETVPLARMQKMVYTNIEVFRADIEIAHFGVNPLKNPDITFQYDKFEGDTLHSRIFAKDTIATGNCIPIGTDLFDPIVLLKAQKLTLVVSLEKTTCKNKWDIWVYPSQNEINKGNILITDKLDINAEKILRSGGTVLLLTYGKVSKEKGAQVAIGFSSIFWNTAWTNNQAPHTLGILCDPEHPVFGDFPTEYHSNWQWWDPVSHSQAMIIDGFPENLKPLIQPIDTWFKNRRLALAFEMKAGKGKLLVCSIDLKDIPVERIVSKQLLGSVLKYMNSDKFNPGVEIDLNQVRNLLNN